MPRLVGFCGAGGTGKTSTAKALAQMLGWGTHPSIARQIFERRGIKELDQALMSPAEALKLQLEIWEAKAALDLATTVDTICDRTPIDNYAYMLFRCCYAVDEEKYINLTNRTLRAMNLYSMVFYFPLVTFPSQDDGIRDSQYGVRACIDALMRASLRQMGVLYVEVPIDTVNRRATFIRTHMRINRVI